MQTTCDMCLDPGTSRRLRQSPKNSSLVMKKCTASGQGLMETLAEQGRSLCGGGQIHMRSLDCCQQWEVSKYLLEAKTTPCTTEAQGDEGSPPAVQRPFVLNSHRFASSIRVLLCRKCKGKKKNSQACDPAMSTCREQRKEVPLKLELELFGPFYDLY